jgi:outer membrane lipoprotein-sorting protein
MKKLFVVFVMFSTAVFAQSKDANKILSGVKDKFAKVKDYQADVVAKLDMEFVKVPESTATVYFKQPDKFKIVPKGFSMIPKQSLNFSPAQLLKGDNTAVYVRPDVIDKVKMDVIKVIPNADTSEVLLSTMWIDPAQSIIRKVETTTKHGGTVITELSYDAKSIPLPSVLKFSFNMGDAKVPDMAVQKDGSNQKSGMNRPTRIKGSVIMTYSNYKINKGLPDNIFEEKKK